MKASSTNENGSIDIEGMQKQMSQINLKLAQFEEQLSIQGSHQKKIIQQNDEYVQQYMKTQETIEKLKNIFRNEQGEEITINLQTYLQQKVVESVVNELKFNQTISQLDNKYREQFHKLNVSTESFKENQENLNHSINVIKLEIKNNADLTHQNMLFKEQMDRIKQSQEKSEKMIQDSIDKFWKYDQIIQQLQSQVQQKVEQNQIQDIQQQLNENFVGIQQYKSQLEMLLGKINAKTDSTYFEEKFNYIDKAVLQTSQKFEAQIERDLKIYFSKMLQNYLIKNDLENGLNIVRQEYRKDQANQEQEFQNKINEIYHQLSENQNNVFKNSTQVELIKSEQILLNQAIKQSTNDCLQKIQIFDQVIQKQATDLLKKLDNKPSFVELKLIESRADQKISEQNQKIQENNQKLLQYLKEIEAKSQQEEEGIQKLQMQLSEVVTLDALQEKMKFIESVKDDNTRIKQEIEQFKKGIKNIEDRLQVKISKFEIDQLRNAIESEYVKIPSFQNSINDCKQLTKDTQSAMDKQLKNRDQLIDKLKIELNQIIDKSKELLKEFKQEIDESQSQIRREQDVQKHHLETCKTLAQKVDESLIYKASKMDLNEFITFCKFTYLDRDQLSKFVAEREEFEQMRDIEKHLNQFKQEYQTWIDTFNKKMCFSFDKMISSPIQFQWVEEIKDKFYEIDHIKQALLQKAEHSDLIRLFAQKANKNLVNSLMVCCQNFKKQLIYEVVSIQSFIKCIQSRSDFMPSQQLAIQMNLRQLTKLLKWITFSSLVGDQENMQDAQFKLEISQFAQMEKVSDSITQKFKLFQKKLEDMGDAKFITSENKILDEYLSMIMQDPAHEEIYGNKQKSDMVDLIGTGDNEVTPQKTTQNQTIIKPFKIKKNYNSNNYFINTVDHFFTQDKNSKQEIQQQNTQKIGSFHTPSNSLQQQFTRETSTFYDPLSQFSGSQKNSPLLQLDSQNQIFCNDSLESLKQSSIQIKQENKTVTVGGRTYEVNDIEGFNKHLNNMSSNSNKAFDQLINLSINNGGSNTNNTHLMAGLSAKTDSTRFQQFYKNQKFKNKIIISTQKTNHSVSQSPSSANSNSSLSRKSFLSPNVIKKATKTQDQVEQTY
ncbi:hypothetical protein TTHERM_00186030 (macronuclear) [Tetrahymena thermophila SB210]|uniref:Uncharacterized protein n=1 Tax=Tetrahymena thermophila (strain SB210) TaxID=312017 RepID=Q22T15_TETTS|nr:hypothetical protein TTHERM_00186030 [Tetrahymena thermophila SB210]EAR88623.2 hypothetical protein TTHERM_00186030 [Tetrahymena thermophila SB210]|eukprot:XP_001008868.2 hypothetical protein TTHERM_00186030 [Tetrahymena thermophila SB210]